MKALNYGNPCIYCETSGWYDSEHRQSRLLDGPRPRGVKACRSIMTSRVLIVDDHQVVRLGVRTLLAGNPKREVCGEAADGEHAIQEFAKLAPDVVILDLSLPVMNGFEVAKEMRRIAPSTKIVFFSMHEIPATTTIVGADAFVAKTSGIEKLEATLERVLQRRAVAGA